MSLNKKLQKASKAAMLGILATSMTVSSPLTALAASGQPEDETVDTRESASEEKAAVTESATSTREAETTDETTDSATASTTVAEADTGATPATQADDGSEKAVVSDMPTEWADATTQVSAQASTDNIVFSVPTEIPLTVEADGTLVSASDTALAIENKCVYPIHVTNVKVATGEGFNLVSDVDKTADTANAVQLSLGAASSPVDAKTAADSQNGTALNDDAAYNLSYAGSSTGSLPVSVTGRMARVTFDMTTRRALCSISWTLHAGAADYVAEDGSVYDGLSLKGLKQAAEDIALNSSSSQYYEKLHNDMLAGKTGSFKLKDGEVFTFRIIGINQDDKSNAEGKAGLTFQSVHALDKGYRMNATDSNTGGWEKSELRQKMNSGEIWDLFPDDFKSLVAPVDKVTQNVAGDDKWTVDDATTGAGHGSGTSKGYEVSKTSDRLWIPSFHELTGTGWTDYAWSLKEGDQYEYYRKVPVAPWAANAVLADLTKTAAGKIPTGAVRYTIPSGTSAGVSGSLAWERSVSYYSPNHFTCVNPDGYPGNVWGAANVLAVAPAFSF